MTDHPVSPNTVLANALSSAEDILVPRIRTMSPSRVTFVVGTQMNGVPHLGTSLIQSLSFAAAARVRRRFGIPVEVLFGALDNAPHEVVVDPATGHRHQRAYAHALGRAALVDQVDELYRPLFDALSERLSIPYSIEIHRRIDAARTGASPGSSTSTARTRTTGPTARTPTRRRPNSEAAMHTSSHTVLYDPTGLIEAELPLDREPYECLVKAVLAWTGKDTLATRDYGQVGLQLTGHACAVAADVRRRASQLPKDSGPRALADVVLREAEGRLSVPLEGTVSCVQSRARLVRALYERLDRLEAPERVAPSGD